MVQFSPAADSPTLRRVTAHECTAVCGRSHCQPSTPTMDVSVSSRTHIIFFLPHVTDMWSCMCIYRDMVKDSKYRYAPKVCGICSYVTYAHWSRHWQSVHRGQIPFEDGQENPNIVLGLSMPGTAHQAKARMHARTQQMQLAPQTRRNMGRKIAAPPSGQPAAPHRRGTVVKTQAARRAPM